MHIKISMKNRLEKNNVINLQVINKFNNNLIPTNNYNQAN